MPFELLPEKTDSARPVYCVEKGLVAGSGADAAAIKWAIANGFDGAAGKLLTIPGADGSVAGAFFGSGKEPEGHAPLATGSLARALPEGEWYFKIPPADPELAALGLVLGAYSFTRYGKKPRGNIRFACPDGADFKRVNELGRGVCLTRDLINTPANDMGPSAIEAAVRDLASLHGAEISVTAGDVLLDANFPMIHAVGRAAADAPRLIDMRWGSEGAPKVTLVGKGVAFDTGGLDIKPPSGMLLMKKDMGGAANVIGLASIIMATGVNVRLRLLVPAVENSISGNAFRPGDILKSRKGITVEIGNTDAEGRLVLADALALADEEKPDLMIDMATLTGAARVALGPELPAMFTDDDELARTLDDSGVASADPLWRMPLWKPYDARLSSRVADVNNVTTDGFAGAVTAALFLKRFVEHTKNWAHFDVFGWSPIDRPHCPIGGEAQAIRAIERVVAARYGK